MFLKKNIDVDVFDDVLQNAKHRANHASNDVNRPPLVCEDRFVVCHQVLIGWIDCQRGHCCMVGLVAPNLG